MITNKESKFYKNAMHVHFSYKIGNKISRHKNWYVISIYAINNHISSQKSIFIIREVFGFLNLLMHTIVFLKQKNSVDNIYRNCNDFAWDVASLIFR